MFTAAFFFKMRPDFLCFLIGISSLYNHICYPIWWFFIFKSFFLDFYSESYYIYSISKISCLHCCKQLISRFSSQSYVIGHNNCYDSDFQEFSAKYSFCKVISSFIDAMTFNQYSAIIKYIYIPP